MMVSDYGERLSVPVTPSRIVLPSRAAFAVPGGLGVQESGYVLVGALLGMPADIMLAISLATRLGELIEGLPGLLAWQFAENRVYLGRRDKSVQRPPSR